MNTDHYFSRHLSYVVFALQNITNVYNDDQWQIILTNCICHAQITHTKGPFKCYVTQMGVGGGGVSDLLKKSITKVQC